MRPNQDTGLTVLDKLGGERVALSFDDSASVHLMSVLTDLYSDPELAVIREYATNARDSHIEAGQERPIEILLPSPLNPVFRIKDYGVGLSADEIKTVYSKYGASTKRETDEQTGMLGLGCKSALTYTNQFTVVAVKDGHRVEALVSRDENGAGGITLVRQEPTDEPNGVEIIIPVKPEHSFEQKAREFFSYWDQGTVLINGQPPARDYARSLKLNDRISVRQHNQTRHYGRESSVVVMGGVAYPVEPNRTQHGLPYQWSYVAHVGIGELTIAPSREALQYGGKRTTATLKQIDADIKRLVPVAVQREIDQAETAHDALRAVVDWSPLINGMPHRVIVPGTSRTNPVRLSWGGQTIPQTLSPVGDERFLVAETNTTYRRLGTRSSSIDRSYMASCLLVTGFDREKMSTTLRQKIDKYLADEQIECRHIVLCDAVPDTTWLDPEKIVTADQMRAITLPPRERRSGARQDGRPQGSYDLYASSEEISVGVTAEEIDTEKPLFYVPGGKEDGADALSYIRQLCKEFTLVVLGGGNRVPKFLRSFPDAEPASLYLNRRFREWEAGLSEQDKKALLVWDTCKDRLNWLDESRVDDPELSELIHLSRNGTAKLAQSREPFVRRCCTPHSKQFDPLKDYPLMAQFSTYSLRYTKPDREHVYLYLNAVYAHRQAQAASHPKDKKSKDGAERNLAAASA